MEEGSFVNLFEEAGSEGVGYFEDGGEDFLDQVVGFVWFGVHVLLVGVREFFLRRIGEEVRTRGWQAVRVDPVHTSNLLSRFHHLRWAA